MRATNGSAVSRAVFDPLGVTTELPWSAEFYPYGFPVSVASNTPQVLEAAHVSWGGLRRLYDERPLEVRCLVAPGGKGCPGVPTFRAQGNLLVASADAENFWSADLERGFAAGWLSTAAAAKMDYLRFHFLEGMAGCLLDSLRVVVIHAACVARGGRGVLLAGDSGAGKSSLAYACARRGWAYCSDDAAALVRNSRGPTVIGNPRVFRFRATAGSLFPEFRGMKESRRANGKPTVEIATASLPAIRTVWRAPVDYVVFLDRKDARSGPAGVREISAEDALGRLFHCPWPRELGVYEAHRSALRRLLRARLVELRYRDLDSAVDLLDEIVNGKK